MGNKFNYESKTYLKKLGDLEDAYYEKYIDTISLFCASSKARILDVGCGNGRVLGLLQDKGFNNLYGIDVSSLFVKSAKKRGLKNVFTYDGKDLPFKDNCFDIIGSFNVLEHTQDPEGYLLDQIKKVKKKGYIIVACPNFLTAAANYPHPRIFGLKNKFKNVSRVIQRLTVGRKTAFEKIEPIIRKDFQYDDDAIVITNLVDIKTLFKKNKCDIVYESGFIHMNGPIHRFVNSIGLLRYVLPSCFIVVQKR